MFWNKLRSGIPLKLRLALTFALLFFSSCTILFWLVNRLVASALDNAEAEASERIADNLRSIHIAGDQFDRTGEFLSPVFYPPSDRAELVQQRPGSELIFVSRARHFSTQQYLYTAYIYHHGEYYEFRARKNVGPYSRKLNPTAHQPRLRRYAARLLLARGQDHLSISVRNPDGSIYLPEKRPAALSGNFRFIEFPFPDGKILTIGRNARAFQRVRTEARAMFFGILGAVTLAGTCAAWWLTRGFFRGVARTTLAMKQISSGDYSCRIQNVPACDREIRELMETFNTMNERTEKLLTEIKMMSDNVAHDLRTPLTRISGTIELLLCDRALPSAMRGPCASVAEETARMKNLVNTIMDISRTNSRPDELQYEMVDPVEQICILCDLMEPAATEKGLVLRTEIPETPIRISADRTKFQRLLSNLLENALRFTGKGSITVRIRIDGDAILLQIADTGCGIAEKDLPHVFQRFYRCDASRHPQGNGLGLALVDAIVKAHGWSILLESEPGVGSTFTVKIKMLSGSELHQNNQKV